jgi:hypothetical protein
MVMYRSKIIFFINYAIWEYVKHKKMLNNVCVKCKFWSKIEKLGLFLVKNVKI